MGPNRHHPLQKSALPWIPELVVQKTLKILNFTTTTVILIKFTTNMYFILQNLPSNSKGVLGSKQKISQREQKNQFLSPNFDNILMPQ